MKTIFFVLTFLLPLSTALSPCQPFGIRLNYGLSVHNLSNPERLAIRFNTNQQCPQIELLINKFMIVHCPIKRVSHFMKDYTTTGQNYTSFIHICSLTKQIEYDKEIEYNLFDITASKKILQNNIKIHIKNPHKDHLITFVHVADWGPITDSVLLQNYSPISSSVVGLIKQGKVDCVILNGDIGYDLNTNVEHHELTLKMIESVASLVPVIVNRGNHQVDNQNDTVGTMLSDYFQLYGLEKNNATGITIGSTFFAIIDPLNMLIPRLYNKFTEESLYSSLQTIKSILENSSGQGKNTVMLNHYPLICGFPTTGHCIPQAKYGQVLPLYVNLKEFYTLVLKYKISLVLSGHVHTYERTFPFLSGYRSKSRERNQYVFNQEFFIQVVEGAAGSNNGIDSKHKTEGEEYVLPDFVAASLVDKTGFGLLYASKDELKYEHFTVQKGRQMALTDQFIIKFPKQEKNESQDMQL